jgi:penicillin-binding protein 1B
MLAGLRTATPRLESSPGTVAFKLKIPQRKSPNGGSNGNGKLKSRIIGWFAQDPVMRLSLAAFVLFSVLVVGGFSFFFIKYNLMIEERFRGPVFTTSARIFARARTVRPGDHVSARELGSVLSRAGYSERDRESQMGSYKLLSTGIQIAPGPQSYHAPESATIQIHGGIVDSITGGNGPLAAYELEPVMITSLSEAGQRTKRQLVAYQDIPKVLVDAVLAIEDRRFFQHGGVNYLRLLEAAWIDFTHQAHRQGGSTITMQLSRAFFLTPEKTFKRKLTEMMIALELEQKFSKEQIFEFYVNRIDLGQRGSFAISGMGEAEHAYFNKDLKDITLPEAALLAGIIQAPSALSPDRHPERALERRNLVLDSMVETHAITKADAEKAKAMPLKLAAPNVEASDAPYFVDLVRDTLVSKYNEREMNEQAYRIYTTVDPELQKAAAQAVDAGMKLVDAQVAKLRTRRVKNAKGKMESQVTAGPSAQVALVVLDPHTGEVLALVGGRNYGVSQLNHATAKRPTGSIFKPFVYAAAINTGVIAPAPAGAPGAGPGTPGTDTVFSPVSMVDDSATTFSYGDQIYEPRNYKEEYHGPVTARYALAMSLNNATVKLAEQVGYDKVADLARSAGIASVRPTPAMALGSYDATPLDMAAAYTVFANSGQRIAPILINSVRNTKGEVLENYAPDKKSVLDPRVAAVMTDMMQAVMNSGTAAGVRTMGFTAPAAGKTGSSHDGWFAGYTSNLLCIVWVGYDDYSDIHLSGAQTAAPIWAEFMKRAIVLPEYSHPEGFGLPAGVSSVQLDKATSRLATPNCLETYAAAFIEGTEPKDTCDQPLPPNLLSGTPNGALPGEGGKDDHSGEKPGEPKKGFFGKVAGFFKGDKSPPPSPAQPKGEGQPPQ